MKPVAGAFHVAARTWRDGDRVRITLPMKLRVERRRVNKPYRFSAVRSHSRSRSGPSGTGSGGSARLRLRGAPDFSLELRPRARPGQAGTVARGRGEGGENALLHRAQGAGDHHREGKKAPSWGIENGSAAPPPKSPVPTSEPVEEVLLIPYGSAKLRITEFPVAAG